MADEIKQRLQDSTDNCIKSYEAWRKDEKNVGSREALQEAIHELRKVASRLEIELAISERDQMAQKPIPIPPHRNAKNRSKDQGEGKRGGKPSKKNDDKPAKKETTKKESANDKAPADDKKAAGGEN